VNSNSSQKSTKFILISFVRVNKFFRLFSTCKFLWFKAVQNERQPRNTAQVKPDSLIAYIKDGATVSVMHSSGANNSDTASDYVSVQQHTSARSTSKTSGFIQLPHDSFNDSGSISRALLANTPSQIKLTSASMTTKMKTTLSSPRTTSHRPA